MIYLISGATHTGKTLYAQKILEERKIPYLSLDHLKMGLIRTGYTDLTPADDDALTPFLWPVAREMIKTAIENSQHLTVEGCYIPFDWADDFEPEYLKEIRYRCLILTEDYIREHFETIIATRSVIENRIKDPDLTIEALILENRRYLEGCKRHSLDYILNPHLHERPGHSRPLP